MKYKLFNADCYDMLPKIPYKSVNLILVDPPYGTTSLDWDTVLDFTEDKSKIWKAMWDVLKDNGTICIFGQEPFSSRVRMSNTRYKYDWYWIKEQPVNVFNLKRRPGKVVENVMVFFNHCSYYPIMRKGKPRKDVRDGRLYSPTIVCDSSSVRNKVHTSYNKGEYYPIQVLRFNREGGGLHPTQKPVALLEYLVQTYTKQDEVVLDFCMGSGSTGVACMNTHRRFIGIEKIEDYYSIAEKRIKASSKAVSNLLWSSGR